MPFGTRSYSILRIIGMFGGYPELTINTWTRENRAFGIFWLLKKSES